MTLITTTDALAEACAALSKSSFITVDTEFLRESTYWPKLCLVQMAGSDQVVAVDALAPGIDLTPFFDLMSDPDVLKVFHAGRQDIEIVWHRAKRIPHPLFDTQVAAMVCGFGDSVSYDQLVRRLTGAHIDKTSRFTDWSRRPLSQRQIDYAIADVTHLRTVYASLMAELDRMGRADWLNEEMAVLTSPATYDLSPENAWRRLKMRVRRTREIAILVELAGWREREAQARDLPRSRVLKDEAIYEIALQAPRSVEALGALRAIPKGIERSRSGTEILAVVEKALKRDPSTLPVIRREPGGGEGSGAAVELMKVLLRLVSEAEGVAAKVIATVDDLEQIASDDSADVPALKGWRRDLFGAKALDLKHGALALAFENGRVIAVARR